MIPYGDLMKFRHKIPQIYSYPIFYNEHAMILSEISPGMNIVDFGCGSGQFYNEVLLPSGFVGKYVGIDNDPGLKTNFPLYKTVDEFIKGKNIREFDVLLMLNVLEHLKVDDVYDVISKLNPYIDSTIIIMTPNPLCLPKGEMIFTDHHIRPIETINRGERSWGSLGFTNVTSTIKRFYSGELIKIKPYYLPPFRLTPEHPVFFKQTKTDKPRWVKAENLNKKGFVAFPRFSPSKIVDVLEPSKYISIPLKRRNGRIFKRIDLEMPTSFQRHWKRKEERIMEIGYGAGLPEKIPITKNLARFFGLFLAEGNATRDVILSFGSHEEDLAEECCNLVADVFGIKARTTQNKYNPTVLNVKIYNILLAEMLRQLFGSPAPQKQIPIEIFLMPDDCIKAFIEGYSDGDGCRWQSDFRIGTSSIKIMYDLILLISRFGITPSIHLQKSTGGEIKGRKIVGGDAWDIRIPQTFKRRLKGGFYQHYDDAYVWHRIHKISKEVYKGNVYNLETESGDYTSSVLIHNCFDYMFVDPQHQTFYSHEFLYGLCKHFGFDKIDIWRGKGIHQIREADIANGVQHANQLKQMNEFQMKVCTSMGLDWMANLLIIGERTND